MSNPRAVEAAALAALDRLGRMSAHRHRVGLGAWLLVLLGVPAGPYRGAHQPSDDCANGCHAAWPRGGDRQRPPSGCATHRSAGGRRHVTESIGRTTATSGRRPGRSPKARSYRTRDIAVVTHPDVSRPVRADRCVHPCQEIVVIRTTARSRIVQQHRRLRDLALRTHLGVRGTGQWAC